MNKVLYEIDEFFQELAEKVYQGVVAHDRQVKVTLVDTSFSVYTHTAVSSQNARYLKLFAFNFIELHFFMIFLSHKICNELVLLRPPPWQND